MRFVWQIEVATNLRQFFFVENWFQKNCRTLAESFRCCGVAVTSLVIPDTPYVPKPIRNCVWAGLMMFSKLVEICRQLVERRTVIADTRRNIVVNSSELGFNIVSYRRNSYASRSNSSELGFNIVLYRSNSYTTRSQLVHNSCYVAVFGKAPRTHEKPRHKYEICTTIYESATR